ncbi:uncharacterized protein PADG_12347 [Paracoccidioides brasiliensis Pb18]|uniref:Uncharacterized protein n=1 Tax=Paracoccidioides brasiliensis (strain Pb18) TaxID=502780 RepID=A0A0A0HSE1_PARBD|nr:uncharacterized protein PADG_12347 [Paracoccidioides brasiliensis Pb18]KGM91572.1 hypothetical protein PADG_12347 [Paracoccidioides brasiliensis Pb18]
MATVDSVRDFMKILIFRSQHQHQHQQQQQQQQQTRAG